MMDDPRDAAKEEFGYGGIGPFTVQMPQGIAWLVTQKVCPGPAFLAQGNLPAWERLVALRQKVHEVLFAFETKAPSRPGDSTEYVPILITTDEAWLLDQVVPFDGPGGEGCKFLMSLYRGIYARSKSIPIEMLEPIRHDKGPLPDFDFDLKKDEPKGSEPTDLGKRDISAPEPDDDLLAAT